MNLLYLTFIEINDPKQLGVFNKVKGQINAFNEKFENVFYTNFNNGKLEFCKNDGYVLTLEYNKVTQALIRMRAYYPQLLNLIKKNYINAVYVRYFMSDPFFLWFLKECCKKGVKIIIEIPTYPYTAEIGSFFKKSIDIVTARHLKQYVYRIVTFSDDTEIFGIKTINIGNGIDFNCLPQIKQKKMDVINLIGVANISRWHGYDRVLRGLKDYYSSSPPKKVYFHVVGVGEALNELVELTKELGLDKYVIFHGEKQGYELDEIFDISHIGIGSLAGHRKGLYKDSALKNREYCARGIPFIIASEDDDFPKSFRYVFRIEPNESSVQIEKVISYLYNIQECDIVNEMRSYAQNNLTWNVKLASVIKALDILPSAKMK